MITRKSLARISAAALVVAAGAAFMTARPAQAQLDPGLRAFDLYEADALVGHVYREGTDPSNYVEHWVMFPNYVYPSAVNGMRLVVVPGNEEYRSATEFLARVPFQPGSRYARAAIFDAERIPGR